MMKDISTGMQDSRFFITLADDASWADGRYSAFGLVTNGMDFIRQDLQAIDTKPPSNYPLTRIQIIGSGCVVKE
jgi:cyclophilin family peptidyl-prolyl cis-trans isomerase